MVHIYIKEIQLKTGKKVEAFRSLVTALMTEKMSEEYRKATYAISKGRPFILDNVKFIRITTDIKNVDIVEYENLKLILQNGKKIINRK
jgi:nucleoside diphosphate kinase